MNLEEITYRIKGALFNVYNELGPGLFESVYAQALAIKLNEADLNLKKEVSIDFQYKDEPILKLHTYRLDF